MAIEWSLMAERVKVVVVGFHGARLVQAGGWHSDELVDTARQVYMVILLLSRWRLLGVHESIEVIFEAALMIQD